MTSSLTLVDDDDMLRAVLAGNLAGAGYEVHPFGDPVEALSFLESGRTKADLLILDWRMPVMTGLDLLKRLRAKGIDTPALFFTSHNDILFEEAALAYGAVDFIDKTRSFAILQKRIELILGRAGQNSEGTAPLRSGSLTLDANKHDVQWRGRTIELTFGEFRVVSLLAQAGRDVTYREIYDTLRGENFIAGDGTEGYRANVRALIKRLREKFITIDPSFSAIVNYPGFGYRWVEAA
ncbi:response regulator transcription factor [Telmatospirillum siberiense]|uniref:DNA-binding response regulator n=1 Tax=Telmatospirillum siberiense TaxID=382514 RepID=A0A2N3PYZ4_9PROT|nr:response regulator transcription factor [Telmatospirillum siberiense]PKU25581.1 DNA-binding response regulator [Telmatospirillum siberiense]